MIISKKQAILAQRCFLFFAAIIILSGLQMAQAQDWVRTGTNLGATKIRLAAANFKPTSNDPQAGMLKSAFDTTLFNDLSNAGIFDMVSKSMAPPLMPGSCERPWVKGKVVWVIGNFYYSSGPGSPLS